MSSATVQIIIDTFKELNHDNKSNGLDFIINIEPVKLPLNEPIKENLTLADSHSKFIKKNFKF